MKRTELFQLARSPRVSYLAWFLGVILGVGAFLCSPPARCADPALDRFVAEVVQRNPGLRARALERDGVRRDASAAGIWPDPELAVMVDNVPERMGGEMPMVRYQLSQMLPWPGKLGLMEGAMSRRAEGRAAVTRARELDLVREAKRAYLMLALNAGLRAVNRSSRNLLTTIHGIAIARYGAGTSGHHEVARAEVEGNALDVEAIDLEGERVSTVAMMNALRNVRSDSPFLDPPLPNPSDQARTPSLAELARLADSSRPELDAMRAMQQEESSMASLARRERYPDLMTSVWYNQMLGAPDGVGVMVGATVPIFNVTRQGRRAEAADLRAASARNDLEAMRAMVRFEIADALRRLETAGRSLDLVVQIAAPRAQESFSSSLSGYSTATVDIVGVLDAWRALQTVERSRIEALITRAVAAVDLERAVGAPIRRATP